MTRILLWLVPVLVSGCLACNQPVQAQDSDTAGHKLTNRTQAVANESASRLTVTHQVTVTNQDKQAMQELDFALVAKQADDLEVAYQNGTDIPYTLEERDSRVSGRVFHHKALSLDFPRSVKGAGTSWTFEISYTTPDRIHTVGDNVTITIPLVDGGVADKWKTVVNVPRTFKRANYTPRVDRFSQSDGRRKLTFTKRNIGKDVLGVSFAGTQTHTVTLSSDLQNLLPFPKTVTLPLPPDLHNQSVYIDQIEPQPSEVRVDPDGNILARYRLWPWEQKQVSVRAIVRLSHLRYDASGAGPVSDTPQHLAQYTKDGAYWPTGGTVREKSQQLIKSGAAAWQKTRQLHHFVRDEIELQPTEAARLPADRVLDNRQGDAGNVADLLVALLRSQDIPARAIEGFVYPSSGVSDTTSPHTWAEAYVAGVGWITLDPVWAGQFRSFGSSSSDRVAVRILGNDRQQDDSRSPASLAHKLQPSGKLPERKPEHVRGEISVTAVRRMVLPGVAYDQRSIHNGSGYIVDNVSASGIFNGSLAPYANLTRGQWELAGFRGFDVSYQVGKADAAEISSEVSWWPVLFPVLLIIVAGVVQFYRYRARAYKERRGGGVTS